MLFRLAALRIKGRTLGISEVRCGSRSGRVVFDRNAQISPERFSTLLTDHPALFRMTSPVELAILLPVPDPEQRAVLAEWLVGMLDAHTPVSPLPPPLTASAQ
jgi:transcription-repair coupling factor (superfamily II helicase)